MSEPTAGYPHIPQDRIHEFIGDPEGLLDGPCGLVARDPLTGSLYSKRGPEGTRTNWQSLTEDNVRTTNVRRAGATGDGETDDSEAIDKADISALSGDQVFFPPGTYRISENITLSSNGITFSPKSKLLIDEGVTVTINGTINAGLTQIFSGEGKIKLGTKVREVYPQWWGATGGSDADTAAIQAANDAIASAEFTGGIPTAGASGKIKLSGDFKVTSTITLSPYVAFEGGGRHSTFLRSYITDGSPVLKLTEASSNQQFYNKISGFTIDGRSQDCQGINFTKCSRWIIDDVAVFLTKRTGLYLNESYLGEVRSSIISNCGTTTYPAVHLTGPSSDFGTHAVTFIGGEVQGSIATGDGIFLEYGNDVSFLGLTVQGNRNGVGLKISNDVLATSAIGGHWEANKGHILCDKARTVLISGNLFGAPQAGADGYIVVDKLHGGVITGNYFAGAGVDYIGLKTGATLSQFWFCNVRGNHGSTHPIPIHATLITSGSTSGTIIEDFNNSFDVDTWGRIRYQNIITTLAELRTRGGLNVQPVDAAGVAQTIQLLASQTGDAFRVVNSGGTTVAKFNSAGAGTIATGASDTQLTLGGLTAGYTGFGLQSFSASGQSVYSETTSGTAFRGLAASGRALNLTQTGASSTLPAALISRSVAGTGTGPLLSLLNSSATPANLMEIANAAGTKVVVDTDGDMVVGGSAPVATAALQVDSTAKGFLPPRMTKAQRNAISSPANGLTIYQTDSTPGLRVYENGAWVAYTATSDP